MEWYKRVVDVMILEPIPNDWATTQMNMGNALQNGIFGDLGRDTDEAIE